MYLTGVGVQVKTNLLNGSHLTEFYKIEDIEELAMEDIIIGSKVKDALIIRLKNNQKIVLFEVFMVPSHTLYKIEFDAQWRYPRKNI